MAMKFRIKDLENYLGKRNNWFQIAQKLTLKSFESTFQNNVLEVDILPNRYPDASSLLGLAKEISVVMGWKQKNFLKLKPITETTIKANKRVKVINKIPELAPYYFGRVIVGVANKPSPSWLKEFVEFYGFNSVNFLVDLSNFVMIETGAPLHIFDLDKIKQTGARLAQTSVSKKMRTSSAPRSNPNAHNDPHIEIYVRLAKKGEKFVSLDNKEYILQGDEIVIADKEKVLALAGIKGGKLAEVDLETKNIFIEAAVFSPMNIYRTSRRFDLRTTAAFRFERKVPPIRSKLALARLTNLIKLYLGGDVLKGIIGDKNLTAKKIKFDFSAVNKLTGLNLNHNLIRKILLSLGIKIKDRILTLPEDRLDLNETEDIVEEIIRLYDYNAIKPIFEHSYRSTIVDDNLEFNDYLRSFLTRIGYSEGYGYNFFSEKYSKLVKDIFPSELIKSYNPLSDDFLYFQNSLIPNLIKSVHLNQFNYKEIRMFLIDRVAHYQNKEIIENYNLGIVLAMKNGEDILKELKGIVGKIAEELNIDLKISELKSDIFGNLGVKINNFGVLGLVNDKLLEELDIDLNVGLIEINVEKLKAASRPQKKFKPFFVFSTITRDLSFFIDEKISYRSLEKKLKEIKINYLNNFNLIDVYFVKGSEQKSMTIRFIFYNPQKNLLNEEVDKEMLKIKEYLEKNFAIKLR